MKWQIPWKTLGKLWEYQKNDIGNKSKQLETCLETRLNKFQPYIFHETPSYTKKILRLLENQSIKRRKL